MEKMAPVVRVWMCMDAQEIKTGITIRIKGSHDQSLEMEILF